MDRNFALDAADLAQNPLRVGLSMEVEVDTRDQSGKTLAEGTHASAPAQTGVYAALEEAANAEITKVIARNMARARP